MTTSLDKMNLAEVRVLVQTLTNELRSLDNGRTSAALLAGMRKRLDDAKRRMDQLARQAATVTPETKARQRGLAPVRIRA